MAIRVTGYILWFTCAYAAWCSVHRVVELGKYQQLTESPMHALEAHTVGSMFGHHVPGVRCVTCCHTQRKNERVVLGGQLGRLSTDCPSIRAQRQGRYLRLDDYCTTGRVVSSTYLLRRSTPHVQAGNTDTAHLRFDCELDKQDRCLLPVNTQVIHTLQIETDCSFTCSPAIVRPVPLPLR